MTDPRTPPTPRGAAPAFGRGYGRDFGGGGYDQGFDGSWGQGYGGSFEPEDYRADMGGPGFGAETRPWTGGPRGGDLSGDETWRPGADAREPQMGPFAGRGPKGWRRSDERLREEVCERLMEDPLLDASEVEVSVEDGVVTLRGEAAQLDDHDRAEALARMAAPRAEVRNELRFRPARV